MKHTRLVILDIAKLIGLALVSAGHLLNGPARNYIYLFHMPYFFIASGMVMADKDTPVAEMYRENRKLIISYYVLNLLSYGFLAAAGIENYLVIPGTNDLLFRIVMLEGLGTLWFVGSLITARILFRLILKLKQESYQIIVLAVLYGLSMWLGSQIDAAGLIYDVNHIPQILLVTLAKGAAACVYIYLGCRLKEYWMKGIHCLREKTLWAAVTAVLCFLVLIPFSKSIDIDMHLLRFGPPVINVLLGIIGTAMVFSLAALVEKIPGCDALAYLGRNSLILMFIEPLHLLLLNETVLTANTALSTIPVWIIALVMYIAELFLVTVFPGKLIYWLINFIDQKLDGITKR